MDIINVAEAKLKVAVNEATFEINACLQEPTTKGSLDRFSKAVQKYTHARSQVETLAKLKDQVMQQHDIDVFEQEKERKKAETLRAANET